MITYAIPDGVQTTCHPAPNQPFVGTPDYVTYLPHTTQGMALLKRLQYAFSRGLLFQVVAAHAHGAAAGSYSSSRYHVVSTLHHKTMYSGGSRDGFPDGTFLERSHCQLDAMGVPAAGALSD